MGQQEGKILSSGRKTAHGGPLIEVQEARVSEEGIEGNVHQRAERRITFLSKEQWAEVEQELDTLLPWTTRRANILVEGLDLVATLGKSLQLGDVRIHINGETERGGQMEAAHAGLRAVVKPACRGGVCGHVVQAGPLGVCGASRWAGGCDAGHGNAGESAAWSRDIPRFVGVAVAEMIVRTAGKTVLSRPAGAVSSSPVLLVATKRLSEEGVEVRKRPL